VAGCATRTSFAGHPGIAARADKALTSKLDHLMGSGHLDDGSYLIKGSKIFISWGEHDLTDNIIHLVLARLPDAPEGTRGISLFLVPKILVNEDGSLGALNDLACVGLEHKLGIHASPTCSMSFGDHTGAIGWLVGEENRGLNCMFTMMNKARLFTGLQGVAIGEAAYQKALAYAQQRQQGRSATRQTRASVSIICHPDVQRNLATMRVLVAAGRAIAYSAARAIDGANTAIDAQDRSEAEELAGLLTPITKAWCSDMGFQVASLGVQVHGGMGYVEETGAAQFLRDARIPPIYEGTNGIQAIDLLLRKVLRPGSDVARKTIRQFRELAEKGVRSTHSDIAIAGALTVEACAALDRATDWVMAQGRDQEGLLWAASPYLQLWAQVSGSAYLVKGALAAEQAFQSGDERRVYRQAIADARFFAETIAVQASAQAQIVMETSRYPEFADELALGL
jgi:alkylation response protein AidB-like acyl-CoA dehydrogenase